MKWIKLSEKKPDEYQSCIVYGQVIDCIKGYPLHHKVDEATYCEDQFTTGRDSAQTFMVLYWMPLPDLPELDWTRRDIRNEL